MIILVLLLLTVIMNIIHGCIGRVKYYDYEYDYVYLHTSNNNTTNDNNHNNDTNDNKGALLIYFDYVYAS